MGVKGRKRITIRFLAWMVMEIVLLPKSQRIQNAGGTAVSVELDEFEFGFMGHLCEDADSQI